MINTNTLMNALEQLVADRLFVSQTSSGDQQVIDFGEDSFRYDFFHALTTENNLKPSQIRLEVPYPEDCFEQRSEIKPGRGRKLAKPEIDLVIIDEQNKPIAAVEFALFKRTSIAQNQDKSGSAGKMFNDITRLSSLRLSPVYRDASLYFVVLTDDEMLKYGHGSRGSKTPPIFHDLQLSKDYLSQFSKTTTNAIQPMFLNAIKERTPHAKIIAQFEGTFGIQTTSDYACKLYSIDLAPEGE